MQKVNKYIKNNIVIIISILILIQPIIDIIIGISNNSIMFTLIRIVILAFLLYYLLFISNARSKEIITSFLGIIFIYLLIYFVHMNYSIFEFKTALRTFYFPIIFLILFTVIEEKNKLIEQKYLIISVCIYAFVIVVGYITNTAFESYKVAKVGTSGYFLAANEVSNIIAILIPFIFKYVFTKFNIKKFILFMLIVSSIFILGTKTPIISLILCSIYYIIKSIRRENFIKILLILVMICIGLFIVIPMTPIYKNTLVHASYLKLNSINQLIKEPSLLDHFLLGSRIKFLNDNAKIYSESSINDKLIGMGYLKYSKLVEMDFNDIFYRQGIIGFLLYFIPILYILYYKSSGINKEYILPIILIVLISTVVGHVITAPSVSMFSASILCLFMKENKL